MPKSKKNKKSNKKIEIFEDSDIIGSTEDALNTPRIEIIPVSLEEEKPEDDAREVFREVMTMTDDERFTEDSSNSSKYIKLTAPPRISWFDDPKKLKFSVGKYVIKGNNKNNIYCVSGPAREKDFYIVILSKSQWSETVHVSKLSPAPKNAVWVRYWDTVPVIKAPVLTPEKNTSAVINKDTKVKKARLKNNKK